MSDKGDIIYGLPDPDYHKLKEIGSTSLRRMLMTPADYKAALTMKFKVTEEMKKGTAVHSALLEPHTFSDLYALQPEDWGDKRKGDAYQKWAQFKKDNESKRVLSWDTAEWLAKVNLAAKKNPYLQKILSGSKAEVTGIYNGYKGRVDLVGNDGFLWDLKTTGDALDSNALLRTVQKYGMPFQAAHYMYVLKKCGIDVKGFGWIFVSKSTPYPHILIRTCPQKLMAEGIKDHQYALKKYAECTQTDDWQCMAQAPQELNSFYD